MELYDNQTGGLYNEPLVGDGAELLWCHDEEANPVSMDNWAIYKVDTVGAGPPRTVILETESGPDCELLEYGYAPVPDDDGSFLGRLKDGLSQVAMSLTPQPLKAMHGGLNTEGPIRRFSDFGAVNLVAGAVVEPAVAGDPIAVTVRLLQGDGFPVGGAGGLPRVGPSAEDGDDLVVVEVIGGPNLGAVVTAPVFDPLNGTYTFTYTPAAAGTDQIRVTAHTRVPQTIPLTVAATAPVFVWEGDSRFVGEDGHKQVGSAGELLTNPAKVRLVYGGTDPAVPVTDEDVTFSFRDRGLDVSATTDSEGYVTSEWRLSDFGESNLLTITAPIADPVEFWALALGQISKWTADGEGWEEDVVGVNDIGYWPRDPDDPDLHDFTKESGAYGDVTVAPGAGVIGDAFSFGPTGGYISAHARDNYFYWNYFEDPPGTPFYDNNITVSAWVWLEPGLHHDRYQHFMTVGNSRAVMEATEAGVPGMPGHFKFYVNGNDPGNGEHYPIFGDMQPMQTGCFYHIAGTLNGSVARAYLNGELFGEVDAPLPEQLIWANQVFLSHGYLGSEFRPNQDGNFVGLMDEPEIWNVALDGAEIAEIYNNPAVDRGKLCQNYDLRGRVLYSNQVLGGVQVSVYSDIGLQDLVASATTGEFGDYYFSDITPGTYWIVAEITSPYSSTTADSHLLGTAPVYHDVQVQKPILNTSPDNPATVAEIRPTLEWTPIAESEAGGYYEVWIHQNSPWQQVHSTVPITQTPSFTLDVDLTPGQSYWWTITAYDQHGRWVGQSGDFFFTVEEPGTDISGTVAYSATPVEGIQVLLHDEATMEFVQEDFTDADGNYLLSEIPDGDYVVTASTPYPTYIGNPADTVSLSGGSLDIDFQIQKPIVLTAPDDDSNTRPTQPVIFEWEANAEAQAGGEYWVQIMEAVGPDPEVFVFNNITTNSVGADLGSVGLIPGMVYNWTVKAFDEDANLVGRTELPRTFKHGLTIAGYVTVEGSTPAGVTLDLSGQWSASTQTDGTGFYKFTGLPESGSSWNITVSDPSGNMTFTPNVKSATPTLVVDSVEVDFTGSYVRSASISGGVSSSRDPLPGTTPLKNVELTATGPDGAQTTLLSVPWDYSFTGLRSGAFRVEVTQGPPEMTFTPAYLDLILGVGEARDGVDFLGEGSTGTISGTITSDGVPLSGVEVIIDGWTGANATTGALGQYSFAQIPLGDYTITLQTYPGDVGFPMTQTLAALSSDGQTAVVDFAGAYVRTASISGQVTLGGTGLAGVDVTSIGPDQTLASTTDLDGNYAFPGLRAGAYTVTMAQPSTFYFPVMSYDTAVAVGETLLNLDFPGIDPGPFDTWDVSVLAGATTLCNGDPGVCSGVADVTLAAVASYPATELIDPWDEVEFHWSVAGSGVWTELGTTTSPTLTDDGITRFYTYQMSLLGTGLPPGPIEVRAVGVLDNDGPVYYETLSNSQITVVSGSAER